MRFQIEMRPAEEILRARGIQRGGRVQKYIDGKVVSFSDKYIPFRSGLLKRAIGTVYGSGFVRYNTVYARQQYYGNSGRGLQGTAIGGLRGRLWFERMKAAHKDDILRGAARIAGARTGR